MNINLSQILVVQDLSSTLTQIIKLLPKHNTRIIQNETSDKSEFLLEQANETIKEAYIATQNRKYILLCGTMFRKEAQNSLLKILEEPPYNIIFIIITTSKTALLPTILSRIPCKIIKSKTNIEEFTLDLKKLSLKDTYTFIKENQRIGKTQAKKIVESIMYKVNTQKIKLTSKELNNFSYAIKLIELNSKPINILTTLLLTLIHRKNQY